MGAELPVLAQRGGEPELHRRIGAPRRPSQGRSHVVGLVVEDLQPPHLLGPPQLRPGLLGEPQEERRVGIPYGLLLPRALELLERVLPQRPQHRETHVVAALALREEALGSQRLDDLERVREVEDVSALSYVYEAIRLTRRELPPDIPLIGFCGAPFTLASYICEGGGSKNYLHTKRLMYTDPGAWHALMSKIARALSQYLNAQVEAGAQAVQVFDSWVGALSPDDYREFVLPHTRSVVENLTPGAPVIHFGTGTATLLELMREAGGDVIGLDWRVRLDEAWQRLGDVAVMGNFDQTLLFTNPEVVRREAAKILSQAEGRPGHIFNLGHGILPETPVENVVALVEAVHELSAR